MTTTMSKARAIEQLQRMGATYIGPAEWQRISNAAQSPTRPSTPVMEPWRHEVTTEAELTEAEAASLFDNLFPPTP